MALLVRDMLSLPVAQTFRLVAGEGGLNNQVRYVNLLDFEYDMAELGTKGSKGMFNAQSFIVTSLQFAKHDFTRLLPAFRQLKRDGVSAIAVKDVYFQTLPAKVVQFANENNIAVFLFASEKNYLEDVVVGMAIALDESENFLALSEKVGQLLTLEENSAQLFRVIHDLFGRIPDRYFCMYMVPVRMMSSYEFQFFIQSMRRRAEKDMTVLPYEYGALLVLPRQTTAAYVCGFFGLSPKEYAIGISRQSSTTEKFVHHIRECIFAGRHCVTHGIPEMRFDEMGIYQILEPNLGSHWFQGYCGSILDPLKRYDENGDLYTTVKIYFSNHCQIQPTAEAQNLHKNTVRYRINKAKELLGFQHDDDFIESVKLSLQFERR